MDAVIIAAGVQARRLERQALKSALVVVSFQAFRFGGIDRHEEHLHVGWVERQRGPPTRQRGARRVSEGFVSTLPYASGSAGTKNNHANTVSIGFLPSGATGIGRAPTY